jgi:hypothetical protein
MTIFSVGTNECAGKTRVLLCRWVTSPAWEALGGLGVRG